MATPITAVREHALDASQPPAQALALLLARWQAAREGQPCPRGPAEAYVPHDIRGLVGKINIVDVEPGAGDFRFRLFGRRNHRLLHEMVPGTRISAIPVAEYRGLLLRHYGAAVRDKRPSLHRIELEGETRRSRYTRLILPVSADGTAVTALLCATLCEVSERKADARARALLDERASLIPAEIPRLRRYALQLTRNPVDADDLVQDCVERALSQIHMMVPGYPVRPWLFAIMHNTHASQARRDQRRPFTDTDVLPETLPYTDPVFESQGMRTDIDRSLQALSPQQKQVVELVLIHGLSYQRAADRLAIPIGTVMSRLARGRDRLRELLAA
jgi:RNA polymerase sigma-70 factor, ECF subfamily